MAVRRVRALAGRQEGATTETDHDGDADGDGDGRDVERAAIAEARAAARERLRRAVAGGDYEGLLDPALRRLFDTAAGVPGFTHEIGALRLAMARLLVEEDDPTRLATNLTKVTASIIRATQAQPRLASTVDPIQSALLAAIGELDDGEPDGSDDEPGDEDDEDDEEGGDGRWAS